MAGEPAKVRSARLHQLAVVDVAGRRDAPSAARNNASRETASGRRRVCARIDSGVPRIGAADRLAGKGGLLEQLEDPVLRHVVRGADLLE